MPHVPYRKAARAAVQGGLPHALPLTHESPLKEGPA